MAEDDMEALRALNDRLQSDLDDALDQIDELEQYTGMGEARQTLEQAQDDVQQLTEKRQELEIQVEELEREHAGCGGNLELKEKELREMKEQRDLELYNNTSLKRQLEKVLADLDKEKARTADLADAQRRANLGKAEAGGELQKLKQENDQLRAIIGERDEDLKVYQEAVAELKGELEDANEEIEELEGMLRASKRKAEEGDNDIKDRDKTLVDLQTTLNERVGELRTKDLLLVEADERARAESVRAASQVSALEGKIRSLNSEVRGLKDSTRVKEVEDENTAMKTSLAALTLQRAELIQQLDENNALLAGYQSELAGVEGEREVAVKEAVADERAKWREVAASQEAAAAALREERARLEETGAVKAEIEALLEEARGRLLEYEKGYGIEDAVREQAALRDALRRRDADIARLTGAAGRQMDAYDLLSEVARRLAIELGKGDNVDVLHLYPELEVRAGVSSNLERLRSLSHELQQQNDVLEEQRIKLLRQLRVHAEQIGSGSGGLKYMGLSGEELMVVNEFAENLRDGKVTLPVSDRTLELQVKNRALEAKLEELHNELARERDEARAIAAASALGGSGGGSGASPNPGAGSHPPPPSGPSAGEEEGGEGGVSSSSSSRSTAKQLAQLRDAMSELTEENRRMREMLEAGGGGYHPPSTAAALEDGDMDDPGYLRGRVKALEESLEATRTELAALRGEMGMNGAGAPGRPMPRTPAGMRLLALHRAASEGAEASKSPADWAQEVRDVRGALVEALEELLTMEAGEEAGKEALDALSAKLGAMTAQHVALYRAHGEERGRWEEREAASESKIAELEGCVGVLTTKASKFDELVGALGGGSGSGNSSSSNSSSSSSTSSSSSPAVDAAEVIAFLGSVSGGGEGEAGVPSSSTLGPLALARLIAYIKSTTRALMEAHLNLPALQRRCEVLSAELAGARAAAHTGELSATEAEAHMRSRILYLELWKKGAETRLERLQVCMDEWVPGGEAQANVSELIELRARLAEALASGAALRMQYLELRELPMRLSKCEAALMEREGELLNIRAALAASQAAAGDSKAVLALLAGEGGGNATGATATGATATGATGATSSSSATLLANATKRELIAALTITRNSAQEGEVSLAAARRAAELYSQRSQELEVALESYSSRCMEMEGVIEALKAASLATPASAPSSATAPASAAGPAASASASASSPPPPPSQAQLTALREERDALTLELHKAKGAADIASEALTTLVGISKDRELEIATLREHLLQLASRSDDDALIGRLQANLLSLKASFHGFLRKHEAQRNALRRSRLAATALETVVDQRSGEVVAVRESGRIKELALQRLCDELRGKLRGLEGGGVTLGQATHFSEAVRRLGATVDRQEEELKVARGAAHDSEGAVLGLRAEVASLRAEIEDVARSASGVEGRGAVRRMAEIHEQLRGAILEGLRARRDLILANDDSKHAQHRCAEYEAMTRLLEERLVASESEHRKREDEHRVALKAVAGSARDAAAAAAAAASFTPSNSSPGDLTLEAKLGAMDAALKEERAVAAAARTAASKAVERARRRRRRVDFLEKQLSIQGVDVASLRVGFEEDDKEEEEEEGEWEGGEGVNGGTALVAPRKKAPIAAAVTTTTNAAAASQELQDTQAAAQATTASLTALIATKNAAIAEYQAQLTSLTLARESDAALAAQERTRLVEAAHAESATTIAKLKAAAAGVSAAEPSTMASTIASAQLADRADALERSLAERDRRVREVEGQLQGAMAQVSALEASLAASAAGNSEGAAALASAAYGTQLAEAKARAEEAERKLKSEVGSRERKLRTLAASFAALKEEFVRAEEEHAGALATAQAQIRATSRSGRGGGNNAGGGGGGESKESGGSRPPLPPAPPPALSMEAAEAQAAEAAALQETLTHMKTQVTRMAREVASLKAAQASSEAEKDSLAKELERTRATLSGLRNGAVVAESEVGILRQELIKVQREKQSLSVSSSLATAAPQTTSAVSQSEQQLITALQRRVSVLEAQNDALLSAKVEQEHESGGAAPSSSLALSASAAMATALASLPPPPPMGTDAAMEWEAGRKLRKRIDDLQAKLTKRTKEAEDATASSAAADAALVRAKSDLEALSKRFLALQKRQSAMDSATVDALAEVESVGGLKARLFAAEEALAGAEGEKGRESVAIAQLKAALEGERLRSQTLIAEAEDARVRLAAMQALSGGGGGSGNGDGGALRREEDRYLAENALRARLAEARRAAASLEGAVLAKDASIMELKFEVETARQAGERLRQRLGEVQALNALSVRGKALVAGKEGGGVHPPLPPSSSSSSSTGPGQRTRREAELEDLVVALRRVTEKQRVDLEKARKGQVLPPPLPSSSSSSIPDPGGAEDASIQVLKVQAATAWSEVTRLKQKLVALESASGPGSAAQASATAETLRRALKVAESEIKTLRTRATTANVDANIVGNLREAREAAEKEAKALRGGYSDLERRLDDAESRAMRAESRVKELEDAAGAPLKVYDLASGKNVTKKVDAVAVAFAEKREALSISQVEPLVPASDTYAGVTARVQALEKENTALRQELEAFDLEFFEEIEDLKFKYAEAAKKCTAFDTYLAKEKARAGGVLGVKKDPAAAPLTKEGQ